MKIRSKPSKIEQKEGTAEYSGKYNCFERSAITENGQRVWKTYETLFVDGGDFQQIGAAFEKEHPVKKTALGNATLTLMNQRPL